MPFASLEASSSLEEGVEMYEATKSATDCASDLNILEVRIPVPKCC